MSDLTTQRFFFPQTRLTENARIPLRLTAIVAGLLLTIMPLLTGCGGGEQTGNEPIVTVAPANTGATVALKWWRVYDTSVIAYFIHYGRESPGQPGSCEYESSMHVASTHGLNTEAMVANLDPNTTYYFAVSAYNGLESPCSDEVSTVTDPPSV